MKYPIAINTDIESKNAKVDFHRYLLLALEIVFVADFVFIVDFGLVTAVFVAELVGSFTLGVGAVLRLDGNLVGLVKTLRVDGPFVKEDHDYREINTWGNFLKEHCK